MYEVIGHTNTRKLLAKHMTSFVLHGPEGVGRSGLVEEWSQPHRAVSVFEEPRSWELLYQTLEHDLTVVITAKPVPDAVYSRASVFHVGMLSEIEVTQILAKSFPLLSPRPVLARISNGSLANLEFKTEVANTFETLNQALVSGKLEPRKHRPLALLSMMVWAAKSRLGLSSLNFSPDATSFFTRQMASDLLTMPLPTTDAEANNLLWFFFGGRSG